MLECRACTWRAIQTIAGDAFSASPSLMRPLTLTLTPHSSNRPIRRRLATTARSTEAQPSRDALSDLVPVAKETQTVLRSNKAGPTVIHNEKALQMELVHLKDRVKLADHVNYTLRSDKPDKALDLCRLASKESQVIVAWNHVIDYHVHKGKINEAIKIFNEMKKRGQFPDSYTYTRIFAGIAQRHRESVNLGLIGWGSDLSKDNLSKALSIYNSMFSPTSRVQPNIKHTNAVLRLCSLAKDMDAAWSVVGKLPENGPGSADHITYSILLGALKHCTIQASTESKGDKDEETDDFGTPRVLQRAIDDGKRIWKDVISRWRKAEITMDENLVLPMANLLLRSERMEDWDDVLNLVQQTTRLERLVPPLGTPERRSQHVPLPRTDELPEEDENGWSATPATDAFKPIATSDARTARQRRSIAWVQPGNGILNVLVKACGQMREPRTAQSYWDKLTSAEYGVTPDLNNFQQILGLLKLNRSSTRAVNLVKDVHDQGTEVDAKTYLLAIGACQRDWKNHKIIENTTLLLDDMEKRMPYPVVSVLESYLSIALQREEGPKIVFALDRLDPFMHVLRSLLTYGAEGMKASVQIRTKEEALRLLRTMIGAIDVMMQRGLVPREDFKKWHARRSQLNTFVGRSANSVTAQRQLLARRLSKMSLQRQWESSEGEEAIKKLDQEVEQLKRVPLAQKHVRLYDQEHIAQHGTGLEQKRLKLRPSAGEALEEKRSKLWLSPAERALQRLRARRDESDRLKESSPFALKDKVVSEADVKKWRIPQVQERLDGLSKWRLPQSEQDAARAQALRNAYATSREEVDAERTGPDFEGADSPMDLAMR